MAHYIARRFLIMIVLFFGISILSFVIIQLPPGDYVSTYIQQLETAGVKIDSQAIERLKLRYGLDQPMHIQYVKWMRNILLHGEFGRSFQYDEPVRTIIAERLPITVGLSLVAMLFVWVVALPIAIYSALHKYSVFDYVWTFIGFIGMALPGFIFAVVLMYLVYNLTGHAVTGMFSYAYVGEPWSWGKVLDLLSNIWLPVVVTGTAGTAGLIRLVRGMLLDELGKQYVTTARAKGLSERTLLWKYPIRMAFNPVVSNIGLLLPALVGGSMIVAIVLNIRDIGSALLGAVLAEDMYLAGSIILVLGSLTLIGTFISDLALAWLDPRIRYA
jgi:peptide/nickel transport system permease protein